MCTSTPCALCGEMGFYVRNYVDRNRPLCGRLGPFWGCFGPVLLFSSSPLSRWRRSGLGVPGGSMRFQSGSLLVPLWKFCRTGPLIWRIWHIFAPFTSDYVGLSGCFQEGLLCEKLCGPKKAPLRVFGAVSGLFWSSSAVFELPNFPLAPIWPGSARECDFRAFASAALIVLSNRTSTLRAVGGASVGPPLACGSTTVLSFPTWEMVLPPPSPAAGNMVPRRN